MHPAYQIIIIGLALSSVFMWIGVIFRVFNPEHKFWWWSRVIVPQGILIAWACKILGVW